MFLFMFTNFYSRILINDWHETFQDGLKDNIAIKSKDDAVFATGEDICNHINRKGLCRSLYVRSLYDEIFTFLR